MSPADGRGAGLGIRAHGFFFERGEPALGIAGREAAVTHDAIVVSGLVDAGLDLAPELGRDGARGHDALAADELAGLLEDAGRVVLDEPVETAADRRIGGDAAGAVRAAAHRADDELVERHGHRRLLRELARACLRTMSRPAFSVRVVPPDCWMTSRSTGRPLAAMCLRSCSRLKPSQPSDTSSTAPTFGCVHSRCIISSEYLLG